MPAGLLDDAVDRRQTEPRTGARRLRGAEGLEGTLDDLGRHPMPGVGHRRPHIGPGDDLDVPLRVRLVESTCRASIADTSSFVPMRSKSETGSVMTTAGSNSLTNF
jgi:hypothetical protein